MLIEWFAGMVNSRSVFCRIIRFESRDSMAFDCVKLELQLFARRVRQINVICQTLFSGYHQSQSGDLQFSESVQAANRHRVYR